MPVAYDWKLEEVQTESNDYSEAGEIIDFEHSDGDSLSRLFGKYISGHTEGSVHFELCLVRYVGNERDGITDMSYAYICKDIELPEQFSDALGCEVAAVPKKYHKMLSAIKAKQ